MECVHNVRYTAHLYYYFVVSYLNNVHIKECTFVVSLGALLAWLPWLRLDMRCDYCLYLLDFRFNPVALSSKKFERLCLKVASNLLSLYYCVVGAILRLKFYMTNQDIGISSSPHRRFATIKSLRTCFCTGPTTHWCKKKY